MLGLHGPSTAHSLSTGQVQVTITETPCGGAQDVGEEAHLANVMKITGNFFIVSCIETIAEGMTLAEKNGIPRSALDTITLPHANQTERTGERQFSFTL